MPDAIYIWIEFDEALSQLQARIRPAPTAAELECWTVQGNLYAYIDRQGSFMRAWHNAETWIEYPLPADERRGRLWLDSAQVQAFEPPDRWLSLTQLARRWGCEETTASNRLRLVELHHLAYLNGDEPPAPVHLAGQPGAALVALTAVRELEAEYPQWLRFDEFSRGRQEFPWLDLRERERFDCARHAELLRTDPARIHARQRAAAALDMPRLSAWLEPDRIAALYGDPVLFDTLVQALGVLPARSVCRGAAISVDDWLHWPGRPPIPGGEAGERVRAWLSMATTTPAPAETAAAELLPVPEPVQPPRRAAARRNTWASVLRRAIQSALNEWERRSRREADVYQFVRNWLEQDARFDWKTTESGVVWSYQLDSGSFKEIQDASLCRSVRREMDRRNAEQPGADTVRTAGHCDDECPAVS